MTTRSGTHRTKTTKKDLLRAVEEPPKERITKKELRRFKQKELLRDETLELDFRKGLVKAAEIASAAKNRPVLVAVFGCPDSGKSHFISNLLEQLSGKGIVTVAYHSAAGTAAFESIKNPKTQGQMRPDGYLFHCGQMREKEDKKSPDYIAGKVLGRGMDVSIAIYNPSLHIFPEGEYDLIVCNPSSYKKK